MRRALATLGVLALSAIVPAVSHGDDQKIAETIIERLQVERSEGRLAGFNVKLEVDQGTVWVKGHVSEKKQQDLVLDVARRVPGVRQVVNDVRVACPAPTIGQTAATTPEPISAPEIAAPEVPRLALPESPIGSGIEATEPIAEPIADTGLGTPDLADASEATRIPFAAENEGIQQAQRTTPAAPSTNDKWIGRTLVSKMSEMERQGVLAGCLFDLHVEKGTVYLEGSTPTERQRTAVLEVARRIQGVRQVVNGIRISNPIRRTSAQTGGPVPVSSTPVAMGQRPVMPVSNMQYGSSYNAGPVPMHGASMGGQGVSYDHPSLPNYAWPSTAAHPNYAALQYPRQYSPSAWPYIGPFYPYPQVPLGWRKVSLEWDDGWWFLDFNSKR